MHGASIAQEDRAAGRLNSLTLEVHERGLGMQLVRLGVRRSRSSAVGSVAPAIGREGTGPDRTCSAVRGRSGRARRAGCIRWRRADPVGARI